MTRFIAYWINQDSVMVHIKKMAVKAGEEQTVQSVSG
jgi:hypothetical protein